MTRRNYSDAHTPEEWAALSLDERGPCQLTKNTLNPDGYGVCNVVRFGRRIQRDHIRAWVDAAGQLPPSDKPRILHHCDTPACIAPAHLFAGTQAENVEDMTRKGRHANQRKTHCPQGHAYSGVSTRGNRVCHACQREAVRRYKARRRARQIGRAA